MKKIVVALTSLWLAFPQHLLAAAPTSSAYQAGYAVGHFVGRAIVIIGLCAIVFLLVKKFRNRK